MENQTENNEALVETKIEEGVETQEVQLDAAFEEMKDQEQSLNETVTNAEPAAIENAVKKNPSIGKKIATAVGIAAFVGGISVVGYTFSNMDILSTAAREIALIGGTGIAIGGAMASDLYNKVRAAELPDWLTGEKK
jgi:hypothetical protein